MISLLSRRGAFIVKQNWDKILYLLPRLSSLFVTPRPKLYSWRLCGVCQILKRCRKMLSREKSMHGIQSQCIVLSTVAPSVAINLFFLTGVKLFSHFTLLQAFISLTSSLHIYIFLYICSFLEMVKFEMGFKISVHAAWKRWTPERRCVYACHCSCVVVILMQNERAGGLIQIAAEKIDWEKMFINQPIRSRRSPFWLLQSQWEHTKHTGECSLGST